MSSLGQKREPVKKILSQHNLKLCFSYDEHTGYLFWRDLPIEISGYYESLKANKTRLVGKNAGWLNQGGYLNVDINKKTYLVHRVIWKLYYGEEPKIIDHINGVKTDNRIENLRSVDTTMNCRNRRISKRNSTGVVGVVWLKDRGKWLAQIEMHGKNHVLGRFNDFFEAVCARKSIEGKHGFIVRSA